jgi:hypothetical protein
MSLKPQHTKLTVAKRSQVKNLRTLWQQETHFSDWLVTQDGIDLLAQDLEIEIENPRREGKGANFSCDIVANIVGDESHVVDGIHLFEPPEELVRAMG